MAALTNHSWPIRIPILDGSEPFAWGDWVSLSAENLARRQALWRRPERVQEPPYFGWLGDSLPGYPETLSLQTNVHTRDAGQAIQHGQKKIASRS